MRKLDNYVARQVLTAMALVLLILGGLDLLFTTIDEISETNELYRTPDALLYLLYTLPRHVYELLPMTALIGALVGLGLLAAGNELVIMQASGVSIGRIVLSVMKPTVLVMVFGLVLGQYIAPPLEVRGEVSKSVASGEEVGLSRFGHWERDGDAFVHFNTIEPDGVLYGVRILVFDDQYRLVRSVDAAKAVYMGGDKPPVTGGARSGVVLRQAEATAGEPGAVSAAALNDGNYWLLQDGHEVNFSYDGDLASQSNRRFAAQPWALALTPDLLEVLIISPDQMAISDLYRYARHYEQQGQDASPYYLAFWRKLLQPLTTGVLVLVAVSFIFGPLREATTGSRVFTAICFGLMFTIVQKLMHNVSLVYHIQPLLAVLLPLVLSAALGLYLFRRTN